MAIMLPGDIGLSMKFDERDKLSLLGLSSTFYDLTLLYDWSVLVAVPAYRNFNFTRNFWYRRGRPVDPEHALYVDAIRHDSPLGLELIIPAIGGAAGVPWILLQSIEKIQNWRLNRRKLRAEVEELESRSVLRQLEVETAQAQRDETIYRRRSPYPSCTGAARKPKSELGVPTPAGSRML